MSKLDFRRFTLIPKRAELLRSVCRNAGNIELNDTELIDIAKTKVYQLVEEIESIMTAETL